MTSASRHSAVRGPPGTVRERLARLHRLRPTKGEPVADPPDAMADEDMLQRRIAQLRGARAVNAVAPDDAPPTARPPTARPPTATPPTASPPTATITPFAPPAVEPFAAFPTQAAAPAAGVRGRLDALRRSIGLESSRATPPIDAQPLDDERMVSVLPGALRATDHGPCYVLSSSYPLEHRHGNRALGTVLHREIAAVDLLAGPQPLSGFDAAGALFLDIETTGLAISMGTLAFLVGTAHFQGARLIVEQWLLRDPEEEQGALADLAARVADVDHLVTFNGRRFDLPLLRARYRANRMGDPFESLAVHLDLLTPSRRMLRHGLPDCRLASIEERVLGVERVGDVPGAEVAERYRNYLYDQDPRPLVGVVAHNRDDVLSMVTLLDELLGRVERPESTLLRDPLSILALADEALRAGRLAWAEQVYAAAVEVPESRLHGQRGLQRVARRRRRLSTRPVS